LVLVYVTTTALVFVPQGFTEPGFLPGRATPHGVLENVLGSAVPAFIVTALVSGRAGVRGLARRSFQWRVPLRWYLISLVAPLLILLIAVTILYGVAPLRALAQNWLLLFTAFLPALGTMILLNNVAEEIGWTGFVFARFQDRHGPLRATLATTVFFWLFHVPSFYVETRSWATTALLLGIFVLPYLGSRLITGWLYNGAGSSVLIAGFFHSMHNAIVNPTGLVAVIALPQFEVLLIMAGIVVFAAVIITVVPQADPLAVLRAVSIPALSTIRKRYRQAESADPGRTHLGDETSPPIPVSFPFASWKTYFQTRSCFSTLTGSKPRSAILATSEMGSSTQIMLTAPPARLASWIMYT
jgi:membrane protease YdiL (CAAX protease family)